MGMRIETQYSSPNHSERGAHTVRVLVLHSTGGSFHSSLSWLCSPSSRVSCHYLISKTGRVLRLVSETRAAWHAGHAIWQGEKDVNEVSIGVELDNLNTGRDPYPQVQVDALTELVLDIKTRYPHIQLIRHKDVALPVGRKTDPAGFPWDQWRSGFSVQAPTMPPPVSPPSAPIGKFAEWGIIGMPTEETQDWAIPRAWLANKKLGRCVRGEEYLTAQLSVAVFENGFVYYNVAKKAALVEFF